MAKDFIGFLTETVDSVTNRKEKDEQIQSALNELEAFIESQSGTSLPDRPDFSAAPEYERLTYEEKSDEELSKLASDTLSEYKNNSLGAIEKEIESLSARYGAEKETAAKSAEEKNASLESAYGSAQKSLSDDVLKRGLARSSIAVNKQSELENAKASEAAKIGAALADTLGKLDNEIAALSQKREKALVDFDISYAAKLTEKIMMLKDEQQKKAAEALKYNNTIAEKEYAAAIEAKEKEASLYGKELDNKQKENNLAGNERSEAVYKKMVEMLDGLNGADARALVMENPVFRDNLSDYYYYKLYDKYTR